jgi:hypothetical protein
VDSAPPQLIDTTDGFRTLVMHRRGDGIEEALVGVGREVNRDLRPGRDGADHFDIEQHLAIGAVRIAHRLVAGAVHRDRGHARRGTDFQLAEIGGEVGGLVSASQFDYGDRLPRSASRRREVVELGHRRGRVGSVAGRPRSDAFHVPPKARPRLRTRVEAEHADHDVSQLARNDNSPVRPRYMPSGDWKMRN